MFELSGRGMSSAMEKIPRVTACPNALSCIRMEGIEMFY